MAHYTRRLMQVAVRHTPFTYTHNLLLIPNELNYLQFNDIKFYIPRMTYFDYICRSIFIKANRVFVENQFIFNLPTPKHMDNIKILQNSSILSTLYLLCLKETDQFHGSLFNLICRGLFYNLGVKCISCSSGAQFM